MATPARAKGGIVPITVSGRQVTTPVDVVPPPTDRSQLIPGTYIPGLTANTVGTLPGTVFTDVFPTSGPDIALTAGTYTNKRFFGNIAPSGTGAFVFNNCRFAGHDPSLDMPYASYNGMVRNLAPSGPTRTLTFTDCTFDGWEWNRHDGSVHHCLRTYSSTYVDLKGYVVSLAFKGSHATFTRCEIVNMQDGIFVMGDNVSITQCAIWKSQFMNGGVGTSSDGLTHCDAVQFAWGLNCEISYNMIGGRRILDSYQANPPTDNTGEDCYNAGFMIQSEGSGKTIVANIHHNWVGGGAASIHLTNVKGYDTLVGVTVANNKVLRRPATVAANGYRNDHTVGSNYYILKNTSVPTITGNVIWDLNGSINGTGTPAPVS